jgi:hypothetical protein
MNLQRFKGVRRNPLVLLFIGLLGVSQVLTLLIAPAAHAANETYTWTGANTIQVSGGNLQAAATLTVNQSSAAGPVQLPQTGPDYCKPSLILTVSSDRTTAVISNVLVTPSAGNPGDPGQNCSSANQAVISAWRGTTVTISGTQGEETEAQQQINVKLANPNSKKDSPKSVTFTVTFPNGQSASWKSNIGTDGNYYGSVYKASPGSYKICVNKIDPNCQTVTKIKYQPLGVVFGGSLGVIFVTIDFNAVPDDASKDQKFGPFAIDVKDSTGKILQTKNINFEYVGCTQDGQHVCGGDLHFGKDIQYNKIAIGSYKVCYGEKCVDAKLADFSAGVKVTLAFNQNDVDATEAASSSNDGTNCGVTGVGWIVCPIMNFMASLNDHAFDYLKGVLGVRPQLVTNTGTFTAWSTFRDLANVAFVVAFIIIVYSQLTSVGISNYGIKRMLPRIVIAAILVNLSYFLCEIAVDLSNIIGNSSYQLMAHAIHVGTQPANSGAENTWVGIVGVVLGVAVGLLLLLLVLTQPIVLLAAAVILLILIARQGFVIILLVVSPLAFVAYLLPNTEQWFKKWWKAFSATLMVYPIIGVVFGGSTLASNILMDVANHGSQGGDDETLLKIVALTVLAIPLFAVPLILKSSLAAAGAVGAALEKLSSRANRSAGQGIGDRLGQVRKMRQARATERAFNREGIRGKVAFRRRGLAKLDHAAEAAERRTKAATTSFINTDAGASARERRAVGAEKTATKKAEINKNRAELEHLASNHALHSQAISTGIDLHNAEEEHKNVVTAEHLATNQGQYNRLYQSGDELKEAQDTSKSTYNRTATGNALGQRLKVSGEDLTQSESEINRDYLNSGIGRSQAQRSKEIGGEINIIQGEHERDYKESGVGQVQAVQQKKVQGRSNVADAVSELAYKNTQEGKDEIQALEGLQGETEIVVGKTKDDFNTSAPGMDLADRKAAVAGRTTITAKQAEKRFINSAPGQAIDAETRTAEGQLSIARSNAEQDFIESVPGRDLSLESQAASDKLEAAKTTQNALEQELHTDEGVAKFIDDEAAAGRTTISPEVSQAIVDLQTADTAKRVQGQRQASAAYVTNIDYNDKVRDETTGLADIAGGIDPGGAQRARAAAAQAYDAQVNEAIRNEVATIDSVELDDVKVTDPSGVEKTQAGLWSVLTDPSSSPERRAAATSRILKIGGAQHAQELFDFLHKQTDDGFAFAQKQFAQDVGSKKPAGISNTVLGAFAQGKAGGLATEFQEEIKEAGRTGKTPPSTDKFGYNASFKKKLMKGEVGAKEVADMSKDELARVTHLFATDPDLAAGSPAHISFEKAVAEARKIPELDKSLQSDLKQELLAKISATQDVVARNPDGTIVRDSNGRPVSTVQGGQFGLQHLEFDRF